MSNYVVALAFQCSPWVTQKIVYDCESDLQAAIKVLQLYGWGLEEFKVLPDSTVEDLENFTSEFGPMISVVKI